MRQRTPLLEWQFAENNAEDKEEDAPWPLLVDMPSSTPQAHSALQSTFVWGRYLWQGSIALLLLLVTTGAWLWQQAEAGLDQIEAELYDATQLELALLTPVPAQTATDRTTSAAAKVEKLLLEEDHKTQPATSIFDVPDTLPNPTISIINLQDDLVVANFATIAQDGIQVYRQTRFYRQSADGWQRTMPQAALWGSPRHLESAHFNFHFRQQDAKVVAAVAPQMDALYAELQRNFGLAPSHYKLVVDVTVERLSSTTVAPSRDDAPLVVSSPALSLAPAELSDHEILAQSIAIPLIAHMVQRLIEEHSVPPHWQPLRSGLKLWQLWDVDLPLASWHDDVVTWLYAEVPTKGAKWHSTQPHAYQDLCASHRVWMLSPLLIGIPLDCYPPLEGDWDTMRMLARQPVTQLDDLVTPVSPYGSFLEEPYFFRSTQAVGVATLIEYAVATHGYEQLPTLLAGLAHYNDWDTLLPATYGVSAADFEQGWQAYLTTHYK